MGLATGADSGGYPACVTVLGLPKALMTSYGLVYTEHVQPRQALA